MKRHLLGVCVLMISCTVSSLLTPPMAYCVGAAEASIDILRGKHRLIECSDICIKLVGGSKFVKWLYQKYGIETLYEACQTSKTVNYRMRGYNAVQVPHIEAVFGKENLESLYAQAKREREAELAAEMATDNK